MNRNGFRYRSLAPAAVAVVASFALPTFAANLLLNPGFEFPASTTNPDPTNPTDWTFYSYGTTGGLDIERANYNNANTVANHTPGGTWGVWLKTFEQGTQGVYQSFNSGVQPNTPYTFSGWYYFESAFDSTSDAVVDVELTFLGASNNDLGGDTATYIYASTTAQADDASWVAGNSAVDQSFVSPPVNTFTQYSVTANAPAGTKSVVVSFDYHAANGTSGANISAFADDGDLEGAGNPQNIPTWSPDSSGDWNSTGNWSIFSVPNGIGVEADFMGAITQNRNIYTDIPVTVGTLNFNNANKYVIDGAGSLTLQTASGNAQVIVQQGTQEINVPLTLASNTTFNVASGANLVIADPISINSGLSLTQTGTGTVTYESTITAGSSSMIAFGNSSTANSLTLLSGSKAILSGTGTVLTLQQGLNLASGAKLDVAKDQVDVDYTGASPAATIGSELATAYANGTWTGNGITSSAASYAAGTSVGYYDNGSIVKVEFTWIGDLNCDGVINATDKAMMGTAGTGWQHGDLNYDGKVNADDYALFAYGAAMAGSKNISMVPEPGAFGCVLAAGLLTRRRKAAN
jgi:hypothetical protein